MHCFAIKIDNTSKQRHGVEGLARESRKETDGVSALALARASTRFTIRPAMIPVPVDDRVANERNKRRATSYEDEVYIKSSRTQRDTTYTLKRKDNCRCCLYCLLVYLLLHYIYTVAHVTNGDPTKIYVSVKETRTHTEVCTPWSKTLRKLYKYIGVRFKCIRVWVYRSFLLYRSRYICFALWEEGSYDIQVSCAGEQRPSATMTRITIKSRERDFFFYF